MITEIQEKIHKYLPLVTNDGSWDDPSLYFYGEKWSFAAIAAWRITLRNEFIFGSDDGENPNVSMLIKKSSIIRIEPQSSDFPIDPAFCFANGYRLEIFSDAGFDTWTFRVPNDLIYDFNAKDVKIIKTKSIGALDKIEYSLPLFVNDISYKEGKLILRGKDWKLIVSSSWRFVDGNTVIFGGSEKCVQEVFPQIKTNHLESIQLQSNQFPVDPVFFFSNRYRLEIFSAKCQEAWRFELPNGTVIGNSPKNGAIYCR